ncbi:MAG: PTS sugar transporter subunit IIA [Arenicella sp.]
MPSSQLIAEDNQVLLDCLDLESINTQVSIASKKKLLEHVSKLLGDDDRALEKKVFQSLIERERLGSTGIGDGVALPHGRCDDIESARLCIVTLDQAIDYDATDKKPVNMVFGLIVPAEAQQQHLDMLSSIAELIGKKDVHKQLLSYKRPEDVMKFIQQQLR